MLYRRILYGLCGLLLLTAHATAKEAFYSKTNVEAFFSSDAVSPETPLKLLVRITPKNDWHIYWDNPGDTGIPTIVKITSDFGQADLEKQSTPKHFFLHHLITQYAYDSNAYWLFNLTPFENNNLRPGDTVSISIDASWQACRDECLDEKVNIQFSVPVAYHGFQPSSWEKELLNAQRTFPQQTLHGDYFVKDNFLFIRIANLPKTSSQAKFIPFKKDIIINKLPSPFQQKDKHSFITVPLQDDAFIPEYFEALILDKKYTTHLILNPSSVPFEIPAPEQKSLLHFLWMAFAGGLILNLMPCIFPILFIKALHLINNAYSRSNATIEALLYFCGVLSCFLIASGLLWLLQRSGNQIGWGFQLQSPIFIFVLFVLFLLIGLMFLGVIHFNAPILNRLGTVSVQNQKLNAFLTGLFAVLIASPCSAPFMGVAIGYSITQPLHIYLPIFVSLAVGYALPFTLICLFPQQVSRFLPKPGAWMEILKKIFAIPVFITCLWLAWIFYNQVKPVHSVNTDISEIQWESFSTQKLETLQRQNKPVFIDFTAKWCLTCLVNERLALSSASFRSFIQEKNITLLKADWTNKDSEITSALAAYQRNSVPLYVYYNGKTAEPIILPQLLTEGIVKDYLR